MTYIIDMTTGETLATDQPCDKLLARSAADSPPVNEPLVSPSLQPVCNQEYAPEKKSGVAIMDIASLLEKFEP